MATRQLSQVDIELHRRAKERGIRLMTGEEFVAMIDKICEGMSDEEREALADQLDSVWRRNGHSD